MFGFFIAFGNGYQAWQKGPDRGFGMAAMVVAGLIALGMLVGATALVRR
ncbi:MAG: hypothetical protein PVJ57_03050 [Phycisphaerae bacterium]|jgi:hypothetical protein